MVSVTFIDAAGVARTVEARLGDTLMETALRYRIPGIEAQCGGSMVCGTCHAYLQDPWASRVAAPTSAESLMLSCGDHQQPSSRLTCQIKVTAELAGVEVRTPPSQP